MAAWQRFVVRPPRFAKSSTADATIIYVLVLLVVGSMFAEFAFALRASGEATAWRPAASALARLFGAAGLTRQTAATGREIAYWGHIAAVLVFLAYIPGSKHRHMFTAIPNIFSAISAHAARCRHRRKAADRSGSVRLGNSPGRTCSISRPALNAADAKPPARLTRPASRSTRKR